MKQNAKCRSILLSVVVTIFVTQINAQFTIKGQVVTGKTEALEGVSISVSDTYYGSTTDKNGDFSFQLPDTGKYTLIFSMMGYMEVKYPIDVNQPSTTVQVRMKEAITDLKAVVITAGTFEASDKKRTTVLKSVDVVTTAGQQADVTATLKTLPGTQQVGETEGLFVRGGTGAETKVFIDGMMVNNPFFSSTPGIAQRSRFSPLLFKGTVFSTGGYSAQYGQALSSALVLESIDLPSRSEVNMIISSAQMSFLGQQLNKAKNQSAGFNINYSNLSPYYSIVKQKYQYDKAPEGINAELNFRKKLKSGMLKFYAYKNFNQIGFNRTSLDNEGFREYFSLSNRNIFSNATYTGRLGDNWQLFAGASYSSNKDIIKMKTAQTDSVVAVFNPELTNEIYQSKVVFTKTFTGLTKLYLGTEAQKISDRVFAKDSITERKITDNYLAVLAESDIYYSSKLLSRAGIRFEYSSLLKTAVVAPRISLAYKLNDRSQVSFAYGQFYQKPETNYLLRKTNLELSKAIHYILSFQKVYNGQTLRLEAFQKNYRDLITTNSSNPFTISNDGTGYAKGIELFWRDKTNIKNLDYWISYSFLDTKRKYLDYPVSTQPSFAAKHTLNIIAKRFLTALSTQFSLNYNYATGRPYFNPNKSEKEFMTDRTMNYQSLGLQANYLKTFGTINAVFIVNVSNALGSKQVFGYRYGSKMNASGEYASEALTPMAKRFVFVGMYLSIGSDRRKNILD